MHSRIIHFLRISVFGLCVILSITSCSRKTDPTPTPTPKLMLDAWLSTPSPILKRTATPLIPPTQNLPTQSPTISQVLLIGQDPIISPIITDLAKQSNYFAEEKESFAESDLSPEINLVVFLSLPSDINLIEIAQNHADTHFMIINDNEMIDLPNVLTVSISQLQTNQIDFLAGYVAAIVTPEWRIGIIYDAATGSDKYFSAGARYFCGLCRPVTPPFLQFPLTQGLQSSADWKSAADEMINNQVSTVYITSNIDNQDLFSYLAKAGIHIIASKPVPQGLEDNWVVSLLSLDPGETLKSIWTDNIMGKWSNDLIKSSIFQNINPKIFTIGKQILAEKFLGELSSGSINTDYSTQ